MFSCASVNTHSQHFFSIVNKTHQIKQDGLNYTDAGCTWLNITNSHWDTWTTMFCKSGPLRSDLRVSPRSPLTRQIACVSIAGDEPSKSYLANMRSDTAPYNACDGRFYPSCFHANTEATGSGCDADACVHSTRDVSRIQTKGDAWRTLGATAGGSVPVSTKRCYYLL